MQKMIYANTYLIHNNNPCKFILVIALLCLHVQLIASVTCVFSIFSFFRYCFKIFTPTYIVISYAQNLYDTFRLLEFHPSQFWKRGDAK